jgi:hypothetical protein
LPGTTHAFADRPASGRYIEIRLIVAWPPRVTA